MAIYTLACFNWQTEFHLKYQIVNTKNMNIGDITTNGVIWNCFTRVFYPGNVNSCQEFSLYFHMYRLSSNSSFCQKNKRKP